MFGGRKEDMQRNQNKSYRNGKFILIKQMRYLLLIPIYTVHLTAMQNS